MYKHQKYEFSNALFPPLSHNAKINQYQNYHHMDMSHVPSNKTQNLIFSSKKIEHEQYFFLLEI